MNAPTPRITTSDDTRHPKSVYGFPYFLPSPLAEVLGPTINAYLDATLPTLLPPYIDPAAEAAVQQYAVQLTGSTMSGPLFLSPLLPTAPAMAATKSYVDSLIATAITDVPSTPPGQVWARSLGAWVPALTLAQMNAALAGYLPLSGGSLSGMLNVGVMGDFGPTGNAAIAINSNNEAVFAFNRNGIDAVKIGLDALNRFVVGGWSWPVGTLTLSQTGNLTVQGRVTGNNGVAFDAGGNFTCYVDAASGNRYTTYNANWYDAWVGSNGTRLWAGPTQNLMTLDASGNLLTAGAITAGTSLCAGGDPNFQIGPGGSGRLMQFDGGWFWDWNSTNGLLRWITPTGAMFQVDGVGNATVAASLNVANNIIVGGQGIRYTGFAPYDNIIALGWNGANVAIWVDGNLEGIVPTTTAVEDLDARVTTLEAEVAALRGGGVTLPART